MVNITKETIYSLELSVANMKVSDADEVISDSFKLRTYITQNDYIRSLSGSTAKTSYLISDFDILELGNNLILAA